MSGEDALTFLLEMLVKVLIDYTNLKKGARYELEQLQKELRQLEAHLRDAAEMLKKTHTFKEKERQIREVVYEVEDTIEICLTKNAAKTKHILRKVWGIISPKMEQKVRYLRQKKVAHALRLMKSPGSGEGSSPSLEQPPTEVKKDKSNSNATTELGYIREPRHIPPFVREENVTENSIISDDVELTYNILRHDLRVCFLYTGLFPKDYQIPASTLTQLWIAERFIRPENGRSLEEIAEGVLKDLIDKKLLEAVKKRLDQVKTCRVNDKIREFCKKKAEEEDLFTVIEPRFHLEQNFYRLCFHSDPSNFLSEKPKWKRVRSFHCLLKEPLYLEPSHMSIIPNAFKPLRVLNCESTKFDELPKITGLILLKHITLSIDNLKFLPQEMSQLLNLQTLIVETESRSITVKANIWKMKQLRHLKTKVAFILDDKKWKGAAKNLQTISRLSHESFSATLSEKAPNLKTLGIRGKLVDLFKDTVSLESFLHLEKLKLVNYIQYGSASDYPLLRLPEAQGFPRNLKRLTLSKTYLLWNRHMSVLARIDGLEVLKLKDNAFIGALWCANDFRSLRFLLIENTDLVIWEASTDNFPELKWLVIKKCMGLRKISESLKAKLEDLDIE